MKVDLLIVGAGASGCAAAISYKRKNPSKSVLILESGPEVLRKVKISGNGRGNFTNENLDADIYNSSDFVYEVIGNDGRDDVLDFFASLGMAYHKDEEGRYYPYSETAKTIVYVLKREMELLGIAVSLNSKVVKITKTEDFKVVTQDGTNYLAKSVIVASGGKNYSTLGSDGSMYPILESLGHRLTPLYPSNIYIKVEEKDVCKRLSGLRFNATIYLMNADKIYYYEKGELLFKDDALSGIVTFNISNKLAYLYKTKKIKNPQLVVDFCKEFDTESLVKLVISSKDIKETLYGIVRPELADIICERSNDAKEIIKNLASFRFSVKSLGDFEHAQVTSGGINTDDVRGNLESIMTKGLYIVGDALDVDAPSGGYNLSFAFLSGIKAGESVE